MSYISLPIAFDRQTIDQEIYLKILLYPKTELCALHQDFQNLFF